MIWLCLLGVVTILVIALRRIRRRITPLGDALYTMKTVIDHIPTGVAKVRKDGRLDSVNVAFATALGARPEELRGHAWDKMFPPDDRPRAEEAYRKMLLMGKASFKVQAQRSNGTFASLEVSLITVHDHQMRFAGHHCLIEDRSRERELEERVRELTGARLTMQLQRSA